MDQDLIQQDGTSVFESNKILQERVSIALKELMDKYPLQDILIITSTGILRTLQAKLLSKTTQEFDEYLIEKNGYNRIPNLALTYFQWNKDTSAYQFVHFMFILDHQYKIL